MDGRERSYYSSYGMASLTKRPTSKFWVACFTDRNGRRRKCSTKKLNRKEAQKIADQFEEAARRKQTAIQVRRVLSRLHREITGDDFSHTSIRGFFESWLERKEPEVAPSTLAFYRNAAAKFLTFLGPAAEDDLTAVTRDQLTRFRNEQARLFSATTTNHQTKFLRMVFRAARREELVADDPAEFVETVRQRDRMDRRPFTLDELRAILAVADEEWKSMILCALYTGQRLSDIAALTWANVDLTQNEIRFVTRKTGKRMMIPIATPLARYFEALPSSDEPDAPVHPRAYAIINVQGKSGHLSNQFADLLAQAGLRKKTPHRKTHGRGRGARREGAPSLSFHCLRHTAVTLLKEAGVPDAAIMALVGHDSVAMSTHYTHIGKEALEKAAAAFPSLL
jgi:integrase